MEESTALRKSGAAGCEKSIECVVVLSVRRDLFRDRLKPCEARGFATNRPSLVRPLLPLTNFSPCASVEYNLKVSRVSAHSFKRSCEQLTSKRSMQRNRSPPKRVKCCVGCVLRFVHRFAVLKLKVLEVREESNEIQYLSTSSIWVFKGKESKTWR